MNKIIKQKIKNIFKRFGYDIVKNSSSIEAPVEMLYNLIEQLRSNIDLTKVEQYRSCESINKFELFFETYNDIGMGRLLRFCCSAFAYPPGSNYCATTEETIDEIIYNHNNIINESKMFSLLGQESAYEIRKFTFICSKCNLFQLKDWKEVDGRIHKICFNMHPSPCQSRCIYCTQRGSGKDMLKHPHNYEKVFIIIEQLKNNNMIAEDVIWQIASGEITIHPFKERIYNLIGSQTAHFSTNCFIFDKNISMNLAINKNSYINFSIDSGTSETWKKVKRVNNFNIILDNLHKYSANCISPDQIMLKYIVLPGINDNLEDYHSIVEIMKSLNIKYLGIDCDIRERYKRGEEQSKTLIKATGHLLAILKKNDISYYLNHSLFSPNESQNANDFADELCGKGI